MASDLKHPAHAFVMIALAFAISLWGLTYSNTLSAIMSNPQSCGIYCKMAINYFTYLGDRSFDPYYLSKSLLSFLAAVFFAIFSLPASPLSTNLVLVSLNGICLILSAYIWWRTTVLAGFSRQSSWLGFLTLFSNQIFLVWAPHWQDSPDNAAFMMALLALYFYISDKQNSLLILLFINAFVQPQMNIFIVPLFVFAGWKVEEVDRAKLVPFPRGIEYLRALILGMIMRLRNRRNLSWLTLVILFGVGFSGLSAASYFIYPPYFGLEDITPWLLPVSIITQSLLLGFALHQLGFIGAIGAIFQYAAFRRFWKRLLICLLILFFAKAIIINFAQGEHLSLNSTTLGRLYFAYTFFQQSIAQPLKSLATHTVFYGAIIAVITLRWSILCQEVHRYGPGLILAFTFVILLSNGSESRHLIAFLPWFAFFVLRETPQFRLSSIIVILSIQVAASRIYTDYYLTDPHPDQYLITMGPWISPAHFIPYFVVAVMVFFLTYISDRTAFNLRQNASIKRDEIL